MYLVQNLQTHAVITVPSSVLSKEYLTSFRSLCHTPLQSFLKTNLTMSFSSMRHSIIPFADATKFKFLCLSLTSVTFFALLVDSMPLQHCVLCLLKDSTLPTAVAQILLLLWNIGWFFLFYVEVISTLFRSLCVTHPSYQL